MVVAADTMVLFCTLVSAVPVDVLDGTEVMLLEAADAVEAEVALVEGAWALLAGVATRKLSITRGEPLAPVVVIKEVATVVGTVPVQVVKSVSALVVVSGTATKKLSTTNGDPSLAVVVTKAVEIVVGTVPVQVVNPVSVVVGVTAAAAAAAAFCAAINLLLKSSRAANVKKYIYYDVLQ